MITTEMRRVLIALGGNALEPVDGDPTPQGQLEAARDGAVYICDIIASGHEVIITHGNGPQVGRILLQSAAGKEITPELPLDVAVAMTQGSIGYHIQNAVTGELERRGMDRKVVSLITQVLIDKDDTAFQNPTKPIGPFYTKEEAKKLGKETGFQFREDSGRGYRRVVPSPAPIKALETKGAQALLDGGFVVVVAGGGGIPVVTDEKHGYVGVEAVIDKDASSALMAAELCADDLLILTAVPQIALHYGQPNQVFLDRLNCSDAERYCKEGHFAPGSMLPKVEAAIKFVKGHSGRRGIITSLENAGKAFMEQAGTIIVDDSL